MPTDEDIKSFSIEFRDGLIGTQPKASIGMCAMVSIPLQAALKVLFAVKKAAKFRELKNLPVPTIAWSAKK